MKQFNRYIAASLSLAVGALMSASAWADPSGLSSNSNETKWGLGVGVGMVKKPYIGYGTDYLALPMLFVDSKWVRVAGPGIDLKLGRYDDFSFALSTKIGLEDGYSSSDASILNGMEKRKGSIWMGPSVTWNNNLGRVTAKLLADASGNSNGQQFSLEASKTYRYDKFSFTPRFGVTWLSANYVDYYYGVKANEARPDRLAYEGKSATNISAGVTTNYEVTNNQSIMLDVGFTKFGSGVTDSSLVDTSTVPEVRIGYLYRF